MLLYDYVDALLVLCLKSHDNGTILKLCGPQVPEEWDAPQAKAPLKSNLMRNDLITSSSSTESAFEHTRSLWSL